MNDMTPKKKNYSDHCRECAKGVWQAARRLDQHLTDLRASAYTMDEDGTNPFKITDEAIHNEMVKIHQWVQILSDHARWWAVAMGKSNTITKTTMTMNEKVWIAYTNYAYGLWCEIPGEYSTKEEAMEVAGPTGLAICCIKVLDSDCGVITYQVCE